MKKTYDYERIEAEFTSSMKNIERGVRYTPKTAEKREKTGTALPFGLRLAGGFLVAALVGGSVFGALKYAEYRGSLIAPGSDPGTDPTNTEFGTVTSFDAENEPDEPAANCVFGGVTVIDTDKVTEDELKTALPLDHDYGIVRGVISEAAEKAGYKVFTYKQSDRVGVCVTKGGKLVFDRTSWALSRVPSRLIVADETPSGHGMIFFTQYSDFSGLYGGTTSVYAYDTVTGETEHVRVFPTDDDPVTVGKINSSAAVGYFGYTEIGYDGSTGLISCRETFEPIYVESYDTVKAGETSISNPYLLGYINGEYVIGTPLSSSDGENQQTESPDVLLQRSASGEAVTLGEYMKVIKPQSDSVSIVTWDLDMKCTLAPYSAGTSMNYGDHECVRLLVYEGVYDGSPYRVMSVFDAPENMEGSLLADELLNALNNPANDAPGYGFDEDFVQNSRVTIVTGGKQADYCLYDKQTMKEYAAPLRAS